MFTVSGTQHSESSKHNLTKEQCHIDILKLLDEQRKNPPFSIDISTGEQMVIVGSNTSYVCVPTSYN